MPTTFNALDPTAPRYVQDTTGDYWELNRRAGGDKFYSIQDKIYFTRRQVTGRYSFTGRRD